MSLVRRNVIANAAGSGWALLVSLAAVPFYIRFLGIEAYGLIGVFLSLTAIFSLLDFGLRATINRRMAQLSAIAGAEQEMRDLLRTLEFIYWGTGFTIGATVLLLAPLLSVYWIKPEVLSVSDIDHGLTMIGFVIACQWPLALYSGGMMGLQKQVTLNLVASIFATVRSLGAVLVLWQVAPTLQAFFAWFIALSLGETLVTRYLLWRQLPASVGHAKFSGKILASLWRFAAGITGISILSIILTQLDKVILSAVLSLTAFGYYTLAWRVAAAILSLSGPISTAFFPRFAQLAVDRDEGELAHLYHKGSQLASVLVLPVALVLVFYGEDFLYLWTHDHVIASNSSQMLGLLALGTAVNGLMGLPVALQLAYGWTRLVLIVGTTAVVLLAPMIYIMSIKFGGVGAAWTWLALNLGYMTFMLKIMHRKLLPGELRSWFVEDTGVPFLAAFTLVMLWQWAIVSPLSYSMMLLNLVGVSIFTLAAAALAAPHFRTVLLRRFLTRPA